MKTAERVKQSVMRIPRGKPFTTKRLLRAKLGPTVTVHKALSRLAAEGHIQRVARGVYVRPEKSRFVTNPIPNVHRVVEAIAKGNGETVQVHGAEAARRFGLSTQAPTQPTYYTSGPSREIQVGNLPVKMIHTSSRRKLQHAGEQAGLALSALWYVGKEAMGPALISQVESQLETEAFNQLIESETPAWMSEAFEAYREQRVA